MRTTRLVIEFILISTVQKCALYIAVLGLNFGLNSGLNFGLNLFFIYMTIILNSDTRFVSRQISFYNSTIPVVFCDKCLNILTASSVRQQFLETI